MGTTDDDYQHKIQDILHRNPYWRTQDGPVHLIGNYLYIGGYSDCTVEELEKVGIRYVLNMAEYWSTGSPYDSTRGTIKYRGFNADDSEYYDILQHLYGARRFINEAKKAGAKVLVHCAMGINRSAAICAAYIMAEHRLDLLQTIRLLKQRRGVVLVNRGFQRRLITYARENGHLPVTGKY